jgi:hypothetical protein
MMKKLYKLAALLSLLAVVAAGGTLSALAFSGRLSPDRIDAVVNALRGDTTEEPPESPKTPTTATSYDELDEGLVKSDPVQEEVAWRSQERYLEEIDQKLALVNRVMLDVANRREAFERQRSLAADQDSQRAKSLTKDGYKKQIELLSAMKAKDGLRYLLSKDPLEAARLVMDMEDRKVKRLLGAARTAEEKARVHEIMNLLTTIRSGLSKTDRE